MQISPVKFTGFMVAIASVGFFVFFLYVLYLVFFGGPVPVVVNTTKDLNPSTFGAKYKKALSALNDSANKISLGKSDISFTRENLFKSFVDEPEDVPMTDSRGRDDPFFPYAAP